MTKNKKEELKAPSEKPKKFFDVIDVNIFSNINTVETFKITNTGKSFKYNDFTYTVDGEYIYLIPYRDSFKPTIFYREKKGTPLKFKNKNLGIPSRALHLLWNNTLYKVLVALEGDRTNLIIIILLLANAILFGIRLYFEYGGQT